MTKQAGKAGQAGQGPGMQEAIDVLRQLLEHATWDDVDARTEAGAKKTLARWQVIEMALARLAAALPLAAIVRRSASLRWMQWAWIARGPSSPKWAYTSR